MSIIERIGKIEKALAEVVQTKTKLPIMSFKLNIQPGYYTTVTIEIGLKDKKGQYLFCGDTGCPTVEDVIKKLEEVLNP